MGIIQTSNNRFVIRLNLRPGLNWGRNQQRADHHGKAAGQFFRLVESIHLSDKNLFFNAASKPSIPAFRSVVTAVVSLTTIIQRVPVLNQASSPRVATSSRNSSTPVSYTHLTLPTIYSVKISVVAVSL